MDVTIIGTGNMARGIGTRLVAGGHDVTVLGKEPGDAEAVVKELAGQGSAKAGRSGDAIADDVVVLAVYYPDAKAAVEQYGGGLSGKVLIDITNPVNETFDGFVTPPDSSAAQELAAECHRCQGREGVQHDVRGHARRGPGRRSAARRVPRER